MTERGDVAAVVEALAVAAVVAALVVVDAAIAEGRASLRRPSKQVSEWTELCDNIPGEER